MIRPQEIVIKNENKNMKKTFLRILSGVVVLGFSLGLSSCLDSGGTEDPVAQLLRDVETIDSYLASQGLTAEEDPNGIRMVITGLGAGLPAVLSNRVNVDYVGRLFTTNAIFDQGNTTGPLANYIQGWQIALTTLPAGSKATLYIPPYWGYGNNPVGTIPANSILVFEIEFIEVATTSTEAARLNTDTLAIDAYLDGKGIVAVKDTTGLRYVFTETGSGPIPSWYDRVRITYTIKLLTDENKIIADDIREPSEYFYSRVVDYFQCMKIALQKMPVGTKATLYSPSGYGYGINEQKDQSGAIVVPANSNLVIELELIEIVSP
jgi:FKBP-type peptidyl-prolyl cis-trans isomerase